GGEPNAKMRPTRDELTHPRHGNRFPRRRIRGSTTRPMTPEDFRRHGHVLIDWIADYRANLAQQPVMSQSRPGGIRAALPTSAPEQPESFDAILRDLEAVLVPGLSHWQHPSFFGYFPSNGDLSSVLGDYLSTGLGVLGLSWQSSPALTELEE